MTWPARSCYCRRPWRLFGTGCSCIVVDNRQAPTGTVDVDELAGAVGQLSCASTVIWLMAQVVPGMLSTTAKHLLAWQVDADDLASAVGSCRAPRRLPG